MRYFLLVAIHLYWRILPPAKRQSCLFRESCSRHVYRMAKEKGIFEGLKAFNKRVRQCKPGYHVHYQENSVELELRDKTILKQDEISEMILMAWKR